MYLSGGTKDPRSATASVRIPFLPWTLKKIITNEPWLEDRSGRLMSDGSSLGSGLWLKP